MKLIIGCGYLGQRVAKRWLELGDRVAATARARRDPLQQLGVEPVVCDVLKPDSLTHLPAAETVLYCVGLDRSSRVSVHDFYERGLENVLRHLPRPRRFLYVSSTSVYGQVDGEEIDETAAMEPFEESGKAILEAERLLRERVPDAVILRFAGIYGPGRLLRRQAIEKGEPVAGDPEKWLNLIHVDDGASAILAAAEHARDGNVYNISDGRAVRRREFYTLLAKLLGAPEPHFVPSSGAPPQERANRRILNRRMRDELGVELVYPSFEGGLCAAVSAT